MALLSPQPVTKAGLTPTFTAVNSSDTITAQSGTIMYRVKNANASADTVTLVDAGSTPGGSAATNPTVNVPATTGDVTILIPASFASPSTGLITVQHSVTASVTAALLTA